MRTTTTAVNGRFTAPSAGNGPFPAGAPSTAVRLPDGFTPGTTRAAAATPTCSCCCCCCCAVSAVSATVALPAGFARDVAGKDRDGPGERRAAGRARVLLALLPALLIAAGYFAVTELGSWTTALSVPAALACAAAFLIAAAGGSPAPWRSAVRLALWCALAVAEFFTAALLLLSMNIGGIVVYALLLVAVPASVLGVYRRRR